MTFRSSADLPPPESGAGPRGVSPELLARTIVVVDEVSGKTYMRADAVAQILRAFPVGWLWSLPLRIPGLRALANWGYDLFSRRREAISMLLGLAACALPARPSAASASGSSSTVEPPPIGAPPRRRLDRRRPQVAAPASSRAAVAAPMVAVAAPLAVVEAPAGAGGRRAGTTRAAAWRRRPRRRRPAPFLQQWRTLVWALREVVVLAFIVTMVSETLYINAAVPKFLKHEQPLWIKRMVAYPRLIQAWSMFASDAPMTDQSMVVDAVTVDGRHVDPYSEATSRYDNPGHNEIPVRLDNDSFVFNYSGRIPDLGRVLTRR